MSAPKPLYSRSGCKVGWDFYATREDAEAAVADAEATAARMAADGYDFGYCIPGAITEVADGTFRVTVP